MGLSQSRSVDGVCAFPSWAGFWKCASPDFAGVTGMRPGWLCGSNPDRGFHHGKVDTPDSDVASDTDGEETKDSRVAQGRADGFPTIFPSRR